MMNKFNCPITLAACLVACLVAPVVVRAQGGLGSLIPALKSYRYGQSAAPLDALTALVSEARASAEKRRETARVLASVLTSDAAFEAKQFACRQLVFIAGDDEIPALAGLLADKELAHYAMLALARIGSPAAADALVQALPGTNGHTEIEILDTLADLQDRRTSAAASERIRTTDAELRDAAASVLAKIADKQAISALRAAYMGASGPARESFGHTLLAAADNLLRRGDSQSARSVFELMDANPVSPILAAAALRGITAVQGEAALPLLLRALAEEGTRRQDAAATLLRELPGKTVGERLGGSIGGMRGQAQLLALGILGARGDAAAGPAVRAQFRSTDPKIRVAAIRAAGSLGDAAAVPPLLSIAASGESDERAAARDSLVRLRGATADRALLAALDTGTPPVKIQAIQALGLRGAMGIGPKLLKAAGSGDARVSAAALRVLRDQGGVSLLPSIVDIMLAQPADGRDAAIDAVVQIARRNPDSPSGIPLLLNRFEQAKKKTEDRVSLITAIGQVGGKGAIEALRQADADGFPGVQLAALSALSEWPTEEPMGDLLRIARTTQEPGRRGLALRGYLRMVGNNEQRAPSEAFGMFMQVKSVAIRPEEMRIILAGLAKIPSAEALAYAKSLTADPGVRSEAELAVVEIGRATLGAWPEKTRAALAPIARSGVNEDARKRAEALLAVAGKFGDFMVAWEVSPSYQRDGADYIRLFDIAFPPEEPGAAVPWRPMPAGTAPDQPWLLDLLALWGGEQRVAYVQTAVRVDRERDLVLEMGSDDGLKAWWNGGVVLSHNVARAVAPGQEKVKVHAKAGWNILLLKVTQNNQGWGACARITDPDGSPAKGLEFSVPSAIKGTKVE